MSYIVRSGNLVRPPVLQESERGYYCFATVVVNDVKHTEIGWQTTATTSYDLAVNGKTAQELVAIAEDCGNIRIVFAGRYSIVEFKRKDGSTGISHKVKVDEIGVSLIGQEVAVKLAGKKPVEEPVEEEFCQSPTRAYAPLPLQAQTIEGVPRYPMG